ncbi:MAG: hypothetical protein K0Q72_3380, partial [Armatimonadetes bacterium]|nr:hypothetical protein [Armatimonadota bacterium]
MRAAGTAVAGILFTYAATCAALAAAPAARLGAAPEVRFERDIRP